MSHRTGDPLHGVGNQECKRELQFSFFTADHDPTQNLDQKVTKQSPSLGRDAMYSQRSRLERLPAYLTVHMVRFEWRGDISKKVKVLVRGLCLINAHNVDFGVPFSGELNSRPNMTR